jgi:hypothetical protein
MHPLDRLISKVAAPVLKDLEFKRKGRWFIHRESENDIVAVWFQSFPLGHDELEFMVNRSLFVRELHVARGWEWPEHTDRAMTGESLWEDRIRDLPSRDVMSELWRFNSSDGEAVQRFEETLSAGARELVWLSDRHNLVESLKYRDPDEWISRVLYGTVRDLLDLLDHPEGRRG